MGFKDPVGRRIRFDGTSYTIVGVVKNMLTQSPYEPAYPSVFFSGGYLGTITIRVNPKLPLNTSLAKMAEVFRKFNPSSPFVFSFNDEDYGKKFLNEETDWKANHFILADRYSYFLSGVIRSCFLPYGTAQQGDRITQSAGGFCSWYFPSGIERIYTAGYVFMYDRHQLYPGICFTDGWPNMITIPALLGGFF